MDSKNRLSYKIKHDCKTAMVLKELRDGLLLKIPLENPNTHFTFLAKDGKFSVHPTNETLIGKDKYDNSQRIEIDFDTLQLGRLNEKIELHNWDKYIEIYEDLNLPGRVYLCGFFEHFMGDLTGAHEKSMAEIIESIYMVRRKQLPLCKDRIIIVYDRTGGVNGRWRDIGLLFKRHGFNRMAYASYDSLNKFILEIASILQIDSLTNSDYSNQNVFQFNINDKIKNLLLLNGDRILNRN